jgi:biotin transport system substrate-specific component
MRRVYAHQTARLQHTPVLLPSAAMTATRHAEGLAARRLTLGDLFVPAHLAERAPAWARDVTLVLAGTALLVLGAYISISVPAISLGQLFVPVNEYVPLTLQTFGVLFTAALLGARRGVSATGLYLLIGIVGFPVFAAGADGVHRSGLETIAGLSGGRIVLGATGGYLLGFLIASIVVGGLAERGWDRRIRSSVAAMVAGSLIIYGFGVAWLAVATDLSLGDALTFGLWPFLPGDVVKLLVAAGLLPLGWRVVAPPAVLASPPAALASPPAAGEDGGLAGPD